MSPLPAVSGLSPGWYRPVDLAEALAIKASLGSAVCTIAGCTDLMVGWNGAPGSRPACLDIASLAELNRIEAGAGTVTIGAAVSCARIAADPLVGRHFGMLAQSARQTGSVAIQNRATLGGNMMNASPAADNPPVLLAYGASVTLASERGERTVAYDAFHTGYRQTIAREDELVRSITLPIPPLGAAGLYRKVGTRRAQAISKVALAALIVREGEPGTPARRIAHARFGLASVAPVPLLARHLSALVEGGRADALDPAAIAAALDRDIAPIDDIRSTGAYRRRVALNLVMAAIGSG